MDALTCTSLNGALSAQHDELVGASQNPSVFLTADFIQPWLEVFGPSHDVHSLAFHRGTELVGLAPLAVRTEGRNPPFRRLMMAGQRPTSGEYLDVVTAKGEEEAVARGLASVLTGALADRWDVLTVQRVLADSPSMRGLGRALESEGCTVEFVSGGTSPYTTLPAAGEDLLAGKSKNFRGQVRQARNRIGKLGDVSLAVVGEDLSLDEGLAHLLDLHRSRWSEDSSFDTPDKLRFHRSLAKRLLERDRLYLAVLTVDDVAIAARYDFVYAGKLWCIQGGWDPAHAPARPGLYMTEKVMEWGVERGLREYDFLGGEGGYKDRWSTGSRDLVTLVAYNPKTVRGRAYPVMLRARAEVGRARETARRLRSSAEAEEPTSTS